MPRVLLTTLNAKYIHLNLAIRILYDLNREGNDLDFCEFTIKNDVHEVSEYCAQYDIVCFSCYIWNITQTLNVCKYIKTLNPHVKILLGGPEVSYEWESVIQNEAIDYIIVGEGEIPFREFLEHYPNVDQVSNLVYKENGETHFFQKNVQFDVQELADRNPYQYDPVEELHNKVCYIETSRGCPYKCEFCLASLDNKMRYLPMETIQNNLLYLMQHGRTIKFLDRTFNIKKDFTLKLFDFILKNYRKENVFQFEITADIVHPDIIQYINERVPEGLFRFEIGIQTVNKESNLSVSRKQNFAKTSDIVCQLRDKIEMHLDLIVGLPLEYWEDVKYSFEQTFLLYPPELQLGFLKFLKGTPVRDKYQQHEYVFDPNPPYQIIRSKYLSEDELYKITLVENALEIYWNKKRAPLTLKYLSKNHSIFDAFLGIAEDFIQVAQFHRHTLVQDYQIIYQYLKRSYSDPILLELLAIDYYTFHKVKPQDLFDIEVEKSIKFKWIDANGFNHHKYRYVMFPISFDIKKYIEHGEVIPKEDMACIQFDGVNKGKLVLTKISELIIS